MLLSRGVRRVVTAALMAGAAVAPVSLTPATAASTPPDPAGVVVARYRASIPEMMAQRGVPGLAVALVDRDRALWVQGFGYRDRAGGARVAADTMFSVQSISKLFTATAVMQAVADGKVRLDEPIITYLPTFTVHSAFEKHPERKITLRMLLSHTAGFTHEAPLGNNYNLDPGTFDAHVRSISDTWLRFPVGTGYAYSNLGIDLAGFILERVEGKPFAQVMRDSLLEPLGMEHSSFQRSVIRASPNRAVGHATPYPSPPMYEPMTAAGGLYTTARDLARFLRFELADGSIDDRVVLDRHQMRTMRTVVFPHPGAPAGYGLGVQRHRWNRWDQRPDLFEHGGGGFGWLAELWWSPQLQLGIAVLTNSGDHSLEGDLALSILTDLVEQPGVYHERLVALPIRAETPDPALGFVRPTGMSDLLARAALPPGGHQAARWAGYVGHYRAPVWNVIDPTRSRTAEFVLESGVPFFRTSDDDGGPLVRHRLTEVERGLFVADNGETLDLRHRVPTWADIRLVRVTGGPDAWQWALLGAVTMVALGWLLAAMVRGVRRGRARSAPGGRANGRSWRRVAGVSAAATAVLVLGAVALLARLPGLVDSGFLGWLQLPMAVRLAMHLPLALVVVAGGTVGLVTAGWVGRWWSPGVRLQYSVLAAAAVALVAQLAAWSLVGWGLS